MPTDSPLLSTAEVATRLGVTRQTVLNYVASGRLTPAQKLPSSTGAYLFRKDDVERLRAAFAGEVRMSGNGLATALAPLLALGLALLVLEGLLHDARGRR